MTKLRTAMAALALVAAAGCASDGGGDEEGDRAGGTTTTRTATTVGSSPGVSFTVDGPAVDLGDGWSVAGCEGDSPVLCVTRNGEPAGLIELSTFPVESFELEGFDDAVAAGDVERAMRIIAADFVRALEADRKDGCGVDYELDAIEAEAATVLGRPGLRYGYIGRRGTRIVERQLSAGTIDGDEVVLVNTPAYAPEGCVPPQGEFTPDVLAAFGPRLHALVAASTR